MWLWIQLVAVLCWAGVNVLDSIIVTHYEKKPYVLQWHQSFFTLGAMVILAFTHPLSSPWIWLLLLGGVIAYAGDAALFVAFERIDVSMIHMAWAIFAVLLSVAGILLFGEMWSELQAAGVVLILGGITVLSVGHRKITHPRTLLWLPLVAVLEAPFYVIQTAALRAGESIFIAFFWAMLGRELLAGLVPLVIPSWRRTVFGVLRRQRAGFHILNGAVVALFLAGVALNTWAYDVGPLSLGVVVTNIQPFVVLGLAYACFRLLPFWAPREHLSVQSVGIKLVSFLIVFAGLALLALSQ